MLRSTPYRRYLSQSVSHLLPSFSTTSRRRVVKKVPDRPLGWTVWRHFNPKRVQGKRATRILLQNPRCSLNLSLVVRFLGTIFYAPSCRFASRIVSLSIPFADQHRCHDGRKDAFDFGQCIAGGPQQRR